MNIFEKVKSAVTLKDVALHYGIKLSNNNMICCPFHDDRQPSMKLNDDYYFCFGCNAYGDVIDFTAKLSNLSPIEAAEKLSADFNVDSHTPIHSKPKHPVIKSFREDELYCFRVLCDYLHILEEWKVKYAPKTPGDDYDERFVEACQTIDYIEYVVDFLTIEDLENRVDMVKILLANGKITQLEERLKQIKEEDSENGRKGIAC